MKYSEAHKSIENALIKFKAEEVCHWGTTDGAMHHKYALPSGTQLILTMKSHFNGEDIEIKWQWILTA